MKRNNCIENIKNEINAKINAHTSSDRDFIVFRPKSLLSNPLIYKKPNPMTSIFELEGKRRNENLLMKLQCKTKQIEEDKSFQIDDHLHIQKCKTFKKFRLGKDIYSTTLFQAYKAQTAHTRRNRQERDSSQNRRSLKKTAEFARHKKYGNLCIGLIQKKKSADPFLFNQNPNNITTEDKENFANSININRLRPSQMVDEVPDIFPMNLFSQNNGERHPLRALIKRPKKDSHKRLQTQLPANSFLRFSFEKSQTKPKIPKSIVSQHVNIIKGKSRAENNGFDPWQTAEVLERPQEFEQFPNSS